MSENSTRGDGTGEVWSKDKTLLALKVTDVDPKLRVCGSTLESRKAKKQTLPITSERNRVVLMS